LDPRRLGRIRLVPNPLTSPPISTLGFDPVLSMPPLTEFTALARKRAVPVKALLLDQAFSAGVGNWVADEILYHARIHPERRANALDDTEVEALWTWVKEVPRVAVELNAEDKRFPEDWLFKHRWVSSARDEEMRTLT
jgi:formamidopyrimidine-DNA glycosylase